MAYELVIKFDGPEMDHPIIQSLIRGLTTANQTTGEDFWRAMRTELQMLSYHALAGDVVDLGARVELTARYDRVKPRVKTL